MLYLSNRIQYLASRERSHFCEHTGTPPTRLKEGALGCVRWLRWWYTTPVVSPLAMDHALRSNRRSCGQVSECGEIGVIAPMRIKDEASRKKERQGC